MHFQHSLRTFSTFTCFQKRPLLSLSYNCRHFHACISRFTLSICTFWSTFLYFPPLSLSQLWISNGIGHYQSTFRLFKTYRLQLTLQKADLFSHFFVKHTTIKLPQDFQSMLSWFELNFTVTIAFVRIFLRAHAAYAMFQGVIPHQIHQIISKNKCSLIFIGTDTCKFLWNTFNVYISMCSDSVYICHVSINYLL